MSWKYRQNEIDYTRDGGLDAGAGFRPSARNCHTGGNPVIVSTDGNNSTPVSTELYLCEVFVPATCLVTGIAIFNGTDVTDNVKVGLYDQNGVLLRASAATAGSGTDAYQRIPFALDGANAAATTIVLPGPGTYYVASCYAAGTSRFNTHAIGNFGAGKITGLVYATNFATTALTVTPPTTFTTALGPIASLY